MDSGNLGYEHLWITSSLRGIALMTVTVECAKGGYHSGEVGGIVPETFRVMRCLLDRIDDPATGAVDFLETEKPGYVAKEAKHLADLLGEELHNKFEMHEGAKMMHQDNLE